MDRVEVNKTYLCSSKVWHRALIYTNNVLETVIPQLSLEGFKSEIEKNKKKEEWTEWNWSFNINHKLYGSVSMLCNFEHETSVFVSVLTAKEEVLATEFGYFWIISMTWCCVSTYVYESKYLISMYKHN